MSSLNCDHLVMGAGLLGLATADHLLRAGASKVLLLEKASSASPMRATLRAPLLAPAAREWQSSTLRSRVLIEGWADYLERDPDFQRSGSLAFALEGEGGGELLRPEDVLRRWPCFSSIPGPGASLDPGDGHIDAVEIFTALQAQVRDRGGRIIGDCEVLSLEEQDDGVIFKASGREGKAKQVLLAGGAGNLNILENLGIRHSLELESWHGFHLQASEELPGVIWFPQEKALLQQLQEGELVLEIAAPVSSVGSVDVSVDWSLLEGVRQKFGESLPAIVDSPALRGVSGLRLALTENPDFPTSRGGKIIAGGGFGCHGPLLAIAAAESLAALAMQGSCGLLEES